MTPDQIYARSGRRRAAYLAGIIEELEAVLKEAGLPDLALRLHGLQHHAVSARIAEGARITLVAKVAGHVSPDLTLRVYSHPLGEDLRAAADKYDPLREAV